MTETRARILFIDDDELILNALRRTLRKEPFECFFSNDPEMAMRIVKDERIDIVVSDHSMPGMTGIEFFALLVRLHKHVMRVMMTGQADRATTVRAINDGQVHRFIDKPWNDDEIKAMLADLAQQVRAREFEARAADGRRPSARFKTVQKDAKGTIVIDDQGES
ncbi:MAG: response regulator [Deltaproteobacteria bacterium]|nr:response regulator [Deltaproteobacteria bacterium]